MVQIEVKDICKSYKTYFKGEKLTTSFKGLFHRKYKMVKAVSNITFSINSGEILGLVGLNGAGKTTIIKMISGIVKSDSGSIKILNEDPFTKTNNYRKSVSLVMGQKGQLDRDLTILDSVKLYSTIYSIDKSVALERSMSMAKELNFDVNDLNKQVRQLSLGQRMKGELILSFLHLPKIIFLDEPTLGLDFITQKSIRNYLKKYTKKYNASILLTSHYINDIEDLCDNIYVIDHGKQLYYGSIEQLKLKTPIPKKIEFRATPSVITNIEETTNFFVQKNNDIYTISFRNDQMADIIHLLANAKEVFNIKFSEDSLDVIIEELYKELDKSYV
ncbi:ATP-binding cassette domain-containing protein [Sedimentibacter sp. zth1]|uniref:ABC transporter ATP-binding protein n=1 Tax=Sedimentibacter sp. zth1 TaxID=2816908 RepID=UPI001A938074|nr:ATP-binding cassette domain-containing protein [Sedimentibacter sp. zth1]QSX06471.1 ATP-binding cassette domain-containing protein [Sedimentibacter sp. zth1]